METVSRHSLFWRSFLPCSRNMHSSCNQRMHCRFSNVSYQRSPKIYNSLQLNELTISTDGAIISYINKAIYHHYIALSKAKRHQLPTVSIESQTDYDPLQFDTAFSESDTYNNLLLLDLKRALSTEEYHVIYDHYFRQYSIQEIAASDNKSRQAINKCKKTALEKLRHYWEIKQ